MSKVGASAIQKGDVVWVKYRKNLWPALIQNVYPKKVTYVFFPIPELQPGKKHHSFSCGFHAVYALSKEDGVDDSDENLVEAYDAALEYMYEKEMTVGSQAPPRPAMEQGETEDEDEDGTLGETSPEKDVEANEDEKEEPKEKKAKMDHPVVTKKDSASFEEQEGQQKKVEVEEPMDEFTKLIFDNLHQILKDIWFSKLVRAYAVPSRVDFAFRLPSGPLSNDDTDMVFEHIVDFVKGKEKACRILPTFHLVSTVLFPEVIRRCTKMRDGMSYDQVMVDLSPKKKDPSASAGSNSRRSDDSLNALAHVACNLLENKKSDSAE